MQNKITEGVIWKQVIIFVIPVAIGAFFQQMYNVVDTIIVGRYLGTLELAAVGGSATRFIMTMTNFFVGTSSGITAYASRSYGEKNYYKLKNTVFNGLVLFTVVGLTIAFLGIIFSDEFLILLQTPEDILRLSNSYLRTYLTGIIFSVIFNTLSGVLRAMGDAKRPLYALIICCILNIVLDIYFAINLGLGVFGIALATVTAQGISALLLFIILMNTFKNTGTYIPKIDLQMIKDISKIGIPAGLQSTMFGISNMLIQSGINSFSTITVAAWSAYLKLDQMHMVFLNAFGSTVITFVGQNLGAKKIDRIKACVKQIILISYITVAFIMILVVTFRIQVLGLFTTDSEVIRIGESLMKYIMPMYIFLIPQQILSQALRGLGKSFVPMLFTFVGIIVFRIFWLYVMLPLNPKLEFLVIIYPLSSIFMSTAFIFYYRSQIKKLTI